MANPYYDHGSVPATGSTGSSASMRAEFDAVEAGFDKLPVLSGYGNKAVVVNAGGTALTTTSGSMSLAGDLTLAGALTTSGPYGLTFTLTALTSLTLPTSGTLATLAGAESLSNKTLVAPILGTPASGTLTNCTGLPIAGIASLGANVGTFLATPSSANLAAAVTDETGSGALVFGTSPTLTTPAITSGVLTTSTVAADPSTALGIASKQYVDGAVGRNPIINGNMEIWQRGTTFAAAANASFSADRWRWGQSGTGVVTIARSTNVPTVAQAGVLFNYSLHVEATTADASIGATDFYVLSQRIEGYNWRAFAQRGFTLSFWVLSAKAGQHAVAFRNSGSDRTYVGTYTSSGAVWERHTITVPASPSAGTWDYTTGTGLEVAWVLEAGSNFHTTAGAWQTGNFYSTSSQADLLDTIGNDFLITGVKLELGSVATPIQFVPFEEELARCQRYYQKSFVYGTAPAQNAGLSIGEVRFLAPVAGAVAFVSPSFNFQRPMRETGPIVTLYNPSAANAQIRNITDASDLTSSSVRTNYEKNFSVQATGTAGTAVAEELAFHWSADAEL